MQFFFLPFIMPEKLDKTCHVNFNFFLQHRPQVIHFSFLSSLLITNPTVVMLVVNCEMIRLLL